MMKHTLLHQFVEGQTYSVRLPGIAYIEEWTIEKREWARYAGIWSTWLTLRDDCGNIARRPVKDGGEREYIELHQNLRGSEDRKRIGEVVYLTADIHLMNQ